METDDGRDRPSLQSRKRKSGRRSSILKSPTRAALGDLDLNTAQENVEVKAKSRRSSRKVSFANTYQVKEFVLESNWNWPDPAPVQEPEQKPEIEQTGNSRVPSVSGLESLLHAPLQNDSVFTEHEPSVQELPMPNVSDENVQFEHSSVDQGGQSVKPLDTRAFLRRFSSNNSGDSSLFIPERQFSQEKPDASGVYNVYDTGDFNTVMNTSVNKYIGTHISATHERAETAVQGDLQRSSMQNQNATRIFHGSEEDADLDFTECMTNKSGVLNENATQCYTENMSLCTRTGNFTSMTLIGDNDTTRVYTTGQENQGLKMTRGPLRDRGDITTTVTPSGAHIDRDHVTDQTVNFKLLDNADADMEMTGCYSATISVSGNATSQQPCETTGQQPITAPGCTSTSADLSRSKPIIDAKSFLARFLGNQNPKQSQEFDDCTGNASSYSSHTAHSQTAGNTQTDIADKTINFKVADMDDSMEMTKCVTQAFPFVATEKEGSVGNTAETCSQDKKQTGSIQTRPGPDTTINFKQIGMNDDIELTTCVTQKISEWQHAATPGGERPNAASDKTINFKTLDADDNMELTQHITQNISTVVPSSLSEGPAKVNFNSKLNQSKVAGSDATINFKQLGTGDDLDFTTCVTANLSEWDRKELPERPNTDTDKTVNFKTMGADDDMEFTQNIGSIVPGSSSEDPAKHNMSANKVQPRMAESETGPDRTINFKQKGGGDDLELTTCATQKMSFLDSQKFSGRDQDNTNTCSDRTINFKTADVDDDMELTQHVTQNVSSVVPGMMRGSTTKLNVGSNQHETDVMPSEMADNKTINFKQIGAGDDIDLTSCVTQNISVWDAKELQEKVKSCTDRTVNFKDLETGGDMELTQHVTQTIQHVAHGGHTQNQSQADQKHETVVDRTINFKQLGVGDDIELTTCVTQNISTWNSKQALPVEGSKVSDDKTINFKQLDVDDNMELTQHGTQTVDSRSVTEQTTNHTVNFKVLGKHDNMEMTLCEPNDISAYAAGERCLLERRPSNQSSCGKEDLSGDVAIGDDGEKPAAAVMGQVNAEVTSNQSKVNTGEEASGQVVREHIDVPDESAGRAGEDGDMEVTMGYSTRATPGRARVGDDMEITMGYSTETTPGRACMREAMEVTEGYSTQTPVGKREDMDVDSSKSESNVEKGLEDEAEKGRTEDNAWVKKMKRRLSQIIPPSQVQDVESGHAQLKSSIKNDAVVTSDDAHTASPAAKTATDIAQVNAGPEAGISLAGESAMDVSLLNVSGLDNLSMPNITMSLLNADPFMMSCKTPSIAVPSKSLTVPGEETTQKQGDDTEVGAINLTSFPVEADFSIGSLDDTGGHIPSIPPSEDPAHTVNVEIETGDDHPQESNKTQTADDEDNVMEATAAPDVPLVGDDECDEMLSQTRAEDNRTLAQSVMDISRSNSILTSRSMLGDLSDISLLSSSNMGEILHFLGVTGHKPKHSRTSIVAPINVAAPSSFSDYLKLNIITSPQVATYQWVVDWISQRIEQLKSSAKALEASLQEQPPKELANVASLSASEVQDLHHKVLTLRNHGLVHAKTQWKQWRIKVLNRIHDSLQEGVTHLDSMMEEVQTRNVNMENAIRLLSQEEAGLDELLSAESSPSTSSGLLEECKAVSQELNLTRAELSEIQAKKSTLAKERAEGMLQEDKLHNRLQELQQQLKAVQQQPQNLAHLKRCMSVHESACAWRLTHLDETQGIFSFPRACIQLRLNFGTCLDGKWVNSMLHRHIKSLSLHLQSKGDASPYYKLCHSFMQLWFDSLACHEWCKTTHQLPKLLEKLSAAVTHTRHLAEEVWEHFVPPFVQVDGDSLTLTVSNLKCHMCFYLTLTFPSGIYPDQQVSWSVKRYIGKISEENLGVSLKRVEPGPYYFTRLVEAVNTYIQSDRS